MRTAGPVSFGRRIADLAKDHPAATALCFAASGEPDRNVTWSELDRRGNQVARLLRERGADEGSMVAVSLPNSPEHVFATIAGWRLGACVLPLRSDIPQWERQRLLRVARPSVIVGDWDRSYFPVVTSEEIVASTSLAAEALMDRVPNPAFAIATSGSTGHPKLVVTPGPGTYDPVAPEYQTSQEMGSGRGQIQLIPAPMYHTNGFRITHGSLHRDELVVVMDRFDAARAVDLIEQHRVTTVTMAPIMLLRICRLPGIDHRDWSSLQSVLVGAGSCPSWLVRWWIDRVGPDRFFVSYGSSESVGLSFIRGSEWLQHPGSVGRGLRTDIRILDDSGRQLPPGLVGEIFLRRQETQGPRYRYLGAPPAKETEDGFTSVGDLGWLDDDGYLYIADRRVDMIVSGGANVFPAEVEAALLEHPEVADVGVVGLPDEEWGSRVHAVVQPADPSRPPAIADLRSHCRERLAAYKVPKTYSLTEALPRTDAGKLNHAALISSMSQHGGDA